MSIHILGIRHHGVGSAKQLKNELERLQPDIILVEGPPEITEVFTYVGEKALQPPVAIMVYNSVDPKESTFYPFASYSPEWVAISHANKNKIPVRALDLPAAISFEKARIQSENKKEEAEDANSEIDKPLPIIPQDPISILAETDGFSSGEAWWEHHFEYNTIESEAHFKSVYHVMNALREEGLKSSLDDENVAREAYMRQIITEARNEMYENIVVVCGAWHAPALTDVDSYVKEDRKTLKQLPKTKIKTIATWIPWTNKRLSMASGYGAGIYSPGWYNHLWVTEEDTEINWLTKVAETFRANKIDTSTAHVIESFKLARSLAAIRNKHFVSLSEMNDAIRSVMCMGDEILLDYVNKELIIGNALGTVPNDIPKMPLQEDFEINLKQLRLKLTADPKIYQLDLRKELDQNRSTFFHRLELLNLNWLVRRSSRTKGTFKETWEAQWSPDMMIALIDNGFLGNTVEAAAQAVVVNECINAKKIETIATLLQKSIPAELFEDLHILISRINEIASISVDILDLLKALPNLINISRYGDVRNSDLSVLNHIVQQLLIKVNTSLANACYGLDEENSSAMFEEISKLNHAIGIYDDAEIEAEWFATLHKILHKDGVHPIIIGCVCRLLLDGQQFTDEVADQHISYALSINNLPETVAAWLQGFLKGSGMILIYDNRLWNLIYTWVSTLNKETFIELLPMLRRSFSNFEFSERRQIGEKAKEGIITEKTTKTTLDSNFDEDLANSILPTIAHFLTPQS
ncbi:hypothetical protein EV196_107131 [Mariniflexile fucanivorans]|uniref:Uncharacterized protein n=1 Tax=Mariniflexile fucanivorans TaxID=264023 RepID=A0A4R1RER5_9FLAO|nr:DUF5682 family protein [Mariniflexile fucanivorans]TCL64424.1 hypothetical protein EV196_107131 [Mariniflexile fucanivorans]